MFWQNAHEIQPRRPNSREAYRAIQHFASQCLLPWDRMVGSEHTYHLIVAFGYITM